MTTALDPRMPEIIDRLDRLGQLMDAWSSMLTITTALTEITMHTQQDVTNELALLKQAILDKNTADQAAVDQLETALGDLKTQVTSLQAQLAAAGQTPTADFDAIFAQIDDAKSQIVPINAPDAKPATSSTPSSSLPPGETEVPPSSGA